jgi:hypothetical protein
MSNVVPLKRPGTLAERFWSIARSVGPAGDDAESREPKAVVRHVLRILDALSSGQVGDGLSQSTVSFLQLLRLQEAQGDMSYASPEQARGEVLDERSLVFSVGVLIFEELTGRHPFGAVPSPRRFARIQKCEMGSGVQYFPQVPEQLRNMLMKAMGPFPEGRFASLKELRQALERFAMDKPDAPPPKRVRLKGLPPGPAEMLFANVDDQTPTMVHLKLPPALKPRAAKTVEVGVPSLKPKRNPLFEKLAWLGMGAGLSLGITLLVVGLRSRAPIAVVAAPVAAATATPAAPAQPAVAPKLEPPALPPVAPATFDGQAIAGKALESVQRCFDGIDHTAVFGAGLLFSSQDALARKIYLNPDEPLSPEERRCVRGSLAALSAGSPPEKSVVLELRFRVRPDPTKSDVRLVPAK